MRRKSGGLVPNERRFLIGGLDLSLQGKDFFWSREIMDAIDAYRDDDKRTGPGTILRAAQALQAEELLKIYPDERARHRTYYQVTPEGLMLGGLLYLQQVVENAESLEAVRDNLQSSQIGKFIIGKLVE